MTSSRGNDAQAVDRLIEVLADVDRRIAEAHTQKELLLLYREASGAFDELKASAVAWDLTKPRVEGPLMETLARIGRRKVDLMKPSR